MDARVICSIALAFSLGSCATERAGAPAGVTPAADSPATVTPEAVSPAEHAVVPAVPPPQPARSVEFESGVLPILQGKCAPCHFPGGKMYARLPFDKPETIRFLGTDLFTRLNDENDQATIRAFLESPPPATAP